jgi:hypothetical protein
VRPARSLVLLATLVAARAALAACGDEPVDAAEVAAVRAQVDAQCDCAGAPTHGAHVHCAAGVARTAVDAGALRTECRGTVVRCAAKSTCGRPGAVTCCRTDASGTTKCRVRSDASRCVPPSGGTACVGGAASCCAACAPGACAATTTTTTLPGRPASCAAVVRACVADADCPAGYACAAGACRDGSCGRRADCAAGGECVFPAGDTVGTCVCSGCGGLTCPLGCRDGFYLSGCICTTIEDCPPEDDVCFMGACS